MNWPFLIILFIVFGMFLLLLEIFIVPGFGPVGIGAIIFLALGTYLAWTKLSQAYALLITIGSIVSVVFSMIFLTKTSYAKKMILQKKVHSEQDINNPKETAGKGEEVAGQRVINQFPRIGMFGIAKSNLRPAGIAEFEGMRVNVLTDGLYINSGSNIKIVKIEGKKIFVEKGD